jgi:hypothetical protein
MLDVDALIVGARRQPLSFAQRFLRALGQAVEVHVSSLCVVYG